MVLKDGVDPGQAGGRGGHLYRAALNGSAARIPAGRVAELRASARLESQQASSWPRRSTPMLPRWPAYAGPTAWASWAAMASGPATPASHRARRALVDELGQPAPLCRGLGRRPTGLG